MKKIAFLNKYQNKVSRGAETFISELSKRLSKKYKVEIISDINYFSLLKNKYDVIIPTNGRWQSFIVRKIAWLTGAKVIISGQSGKGLDDRLNLYSFPNVFVGLTKYQSNWARRINPFIRVETVPNGVDLSNFKAMVHNGNKNTVLSVGAFTKEKRHNLTIDAVKKLDGVGLVIVGSGGERKKEIMDYGQKVLGKERFSVLSTTHDRMPEIYRKADVFAFSTVPWESFGIVLLEAMATGLSVVATKDPIRQEIVGNAGILVNPENSEEYSKALEKALKTNWGGIPREQAEKFSWDSVAQKYEEIIENITSEK